MRTPYIIVIVLALRLVSGCATKVNNPADAKAIRDLDAEYSKDFTSQDVAWFSTKYFANGAIELPPKSFHV